MTYSDLLKRIEALSPEQQASEVVFRDHFAEPTFGKVTAFTIIETLEGIQEGKESDNSEEERLSDRFIYDIGGKSQKMPLKIGQPVLSY